MFKAEADVMAKVSAHPFIVQVFQSGVSPDGRPYLVMEYYPGPDHYERARTEHMAIDEVLRVTVQVASAVETAHRAGVLHRDIKPANILTSTYGRRPGLSDFGIASVAGPAASAAEGLSIPWSPPEAFGRPTTDKRSDVYSLAATTYTLLAGRSPFEIRGGDNSALALISRIERDPVPPTGRGDVPATLAELLARAMSKNPQHRPATAADFAREIQAIETELRLPVTQLELETSAPIRPRTPADTDDEATSLKVIPEIHAQGTTGNGAVHGLISDVPAAPRFVSGTFGRPSEGLLDTPEVEETIHWERSTPDVVGSAPTPPPARSRVPLIVGAVVAVFVVTALALVPVLAGGSGGDRSPVETLGADDVNDQIGDPTDVAPTAVDSFVGVAAGNDSFTFTWKPVDGISTYRIRSNGSTKVEKVAVTTYTSPSQCIEVQAESDSGQISAPTRGCAP